MAKKKDRSEKESWQVPEIDLNLRHYAGHPSDVITKIKFDIENYVNTPGVPEEKIQIYSAIYNALNYYKAISYIPSVDFITGDTYLDKALHDFNEDYSFLDTKFNSQDPTQEKVIKVSGRIKSPISFVDKIVEKMTEYLDEGRDCRYFNESLRDLIGLRFIVDVPKEYQDLGPQAESTYLYTVANQLLLHRGILKKPEEKTQSDYSFITVNSRYDPQKNEKIRTRYLTQGLSPELYDKNGKLLISIPEKRPDFIEDPRISKYIKDYVYNPKFSGYQSLHICMHPGFADELEVLPIPKGIIPPASRNYSFEYQLRTQRQDDFAEHGIASHKQSYKPQEDFHRLFIPFYISLDESSQSLKLLNLADSHEKHYGYTLESLLGISLAKMRDTFDTDTINEILARTKVILPHEDGTFDLVDTDKKMISCKVDSVSAKQEVSKVEPKKSTILPSTSSLQISDILAPNSIFLCLTVDKLIDIQKAIETHDNALLSRLLDKLNVTDNIYSVSRTTAEQIKSPDVKITSEEPSKVTTKQNPIKSIKLVSIVEGQIKDKDQEESQEKKEKTSESTSESKKTDTTTVSANEGKKASSNIKSDKVDDDRDI